MVEEQIDEVVLLPQQQPMLAADEAEAVAQLQDEILELVDQVILQLALPDGLADAEEFEVVGALQRFLSLLRQVLRQGEREVVGLPSARLRA